MKNIPEHNKILRKNDNKSSLLKVGFAKKIWPKINLKIEHEQMT